MGTQAKTNKRTNKHKDLQPASGLWDLYKSSEARYAFHAKNNSEARRWQQTTREAFGQALGLDKISGTKPQARKIGQTDKGNYIREKLLLRTGPKTLMPVYMLLPKGARRSLPVVVAFHGHGYGVKDIVGLWEDGGERNSPDGYHKDFAISLCRAGFAVAAPEVSCFGERQSDFSHLEQGQPVPGTCEHSAMLAFHLGISVAGLRVHDAMRLIDYLETRKDLDCSRLGAMGISGGGFLTMYSACMDPRIRACVVSGYFSSFEDSILAMSHCPCNFVPGMVRFGEMHDLAGLIAPRPMLVEAGDHDPIFPVRAARAGVTKARRIYEIFGKQDGIEADYFEGRHQISGRKAYDFLKRELGE